MRILVSNDDGIYAAGIRALVESLVTEQEVYVIAPDRERSAAGHSLTLHTPLRAEEVDMDLKVARAWAITGTPGDCIKIGVNAILDFKPDLIISGINHGPNLGADVLYSGTVSAAMEGAVLNFPSIAISLASNGKVANMDFKYSAEFIRKFIRRIPEIKFPKKTILNINVPAIDGNFITGIEMTKLGTRMYTDTYEKRIDPRGKVYYWLAGEMVTTDEEAGTDITAIRNNKISITPVTFEMTNKNIIKELEKVFCEESCNWF